MTGTLARPDWSVSLDGVDLSDTLRPFFMRMSLSEKRETAADQLRLTIDDSGHGGVRIALPPPGASIVIAMGWKIAPPGAAAGLIDKGTFIVDEIRHSGSPDVIELTARSADFTSEWRKRRDAKWEDTTVGSILEELSGRHGLTLRAESGLAGKERKLVTQSRESDMALLRRLGTEYHAVATVKDGNLLFIPLAGGKTADGTALPAVTVRRSDGDGHSFTIAKRQDYSGVTAKWQDRQQAKRKVKKVEGAETVKRSTHSTVSAGSDDNAKVLSKVYPSEAEAQRAADAEWSRIRRAPRRLSLNLAYGRPEIEAEQPLIVEGFREEITAENWIVAECTHTLDGNGLTSTLSCEVPVEG